MAAPNSPALREPATGDWVSLREVIELAFKRRLAVLAAFVLPPLLAFGLLHATPRVYRAESDILVKTGHEYLAQSDRDSTSAPTSTKQEEINSEIALLTSRSVAEATIRAIGLAQLYPGSSREAPTSRALDQAVERFGHDLAVEPVKLSNIISVSFDARSPGKAQMVLDRLIAVYIAKHTQVFAGRLTQGYPESLNHIVQSIDSLERHRTRIKLDHGIYDVAVQRDTLIAQRADAQNRLQDVLKNQSMLHERLAYLRRVRPSIADTVNASNVDNNDEAAHLRESLSELRQSQAALSQRYGEASPERQRMRLQIEALQGSLAATSERRTSQSSAPSPLGQVVDQQIVMGAADLATADAEVAHYTARVGSIDDELRRIERADLDLRVTGSRIDVLIEDLKTVQGRYDQARTQEQSDLARQVSVVQVSPAISPDKPAKPRKIVYAATGVLLGAFAAGGVVMLGLLTNRTVLTEDALQRWLGLPVLASLPMLPSGETDGNDWGMRWLRRLDRFRPRPRRLLVGAYAEANRHPEALARAWWVGRIEQPDK